MAVTARQNNKQRKDGNPPLSNANRRGAWRGGPPSFVQSHQNSRGPGGPLQGQHGYGSPQPPRSPLHGIENALNVHVVVTTRNGVRHSGFVDSIDPDGSGFTLRNYRDLSAPNMSEKDSMRFPAIQLLNWQRSEPPAANGAPPTPAKGFRTDSDISQNGPNPRERELQAWSDGTNTPSGVPPPGPPPGAPGGRGDDITFGSTGSGSWDQFTVNHQLFGVTTNYDEELYTTKLDRSRPDFKERERQAQQIANEIQSSTTNNPHVAEERGALDDSGINEEDKYGAVVRGPNAYVPPAARNNTLSASTSAPSQSASGAPVASSNDVPKAATKPNGSEASASVGPPKENNLVGSFRDFVTNEKQRLAQKKQQIFKKEKDNRLADLLKFSQEFKLNRPIPEDLVPILAKDERKQQELLDKSRKEAGSSGARAIGATITTAAAARGPPPTVIKPEARRPPVPLGPVAAANPTAAKLAVKAASIAAAAATATPATTSSAPTPTPAPAALATKRMVIQQIPPFKGKRSADASGTSSVNGSVTSTATGSASTTPKNADDGIPASPTSATSSSFKLNVKATSFKPNPNASAFKPGGVQSPPNASPATNSSTSRSESKGNNNHPFFGTTVIRMNAVHIKDDFNPFRHGKVPDAKSIVANWPYDGKRFMVMFPRTPSVPPSSAQQPPGPQPGQPGQPGQPQVPQGAPPPYEEDPSQAAARQYPMVYTYAPYPYPPQPMLPVPGAAPPTGYMQSPFVQHVHFPHQGNPHPTMFAPPPTLNGMPPPQGFIPQPPPGPYPPNGAGPRGSMPPTPVQQHAYAFHQSPQLPHAVQYPMMLAQPPPIPQGTPTGHPYENQGGLPVQPGAPGPMGAGH